MKDVLKQKFEKLVKSHKPIFNDLIEFLFRRLAALVCLPLRRVPQALRPAEEPDCPRAQRVRPVAPLPVPAVSAPGQAQREHEETRLSQTSDTIRNHAR